MPAHPLYSRPEYADSSTPLPTTRAPPVRAPTRTNPSLRRGKTLTRPERSVAPAPLINPLTSASANSVLSEPSSLDAWRITSLIVTFWAPAILLSSLGGLHDKATRQAWREKVTLCFIALILGGGVGFATVGLDRVLCPASSQNNPARFSRIGSTPGTLGIHGFQFDVKNSVPLDAISLTSLAKGNPGMDITNMFKRTAADFPKCQGLSFKAASDPPCPNNDSCPLDALSAATISTAKITNSTYRVGYDWEQVANLTNYFVVDGRVLNLTPYITAHTSAISGDPVDAAIRSLIRGDQSASGKDGTRLFYNRANLKDAVPCLLERYNAGDIDKITPGCFISNLFLYAGLLLILGLVLVRFAMACIFNWFLSARLIAPPKNMSRRVISPSILPEGANVAVDNATGTAPWAKNGKKSKISKGRPASPSPSMATTLASAGSSQTVSSSTITMGTIGAELFTVCLVTCYSEGEDSLRTTLDSIANTSYSDSRKLLFIVADGMITGAGEKRSTPDICVSLLEADPRFGTPMPMSYVAVGSGSKAENRAMVYAGHYTVSGRRTPTVIIVKCGTEAEAAKEKKPGNRGKRDGQLILMNFFSRVTYNDRMTPLDFDIFRKIHVLMGVTPDFFEVCLMVDADTKVYPDSLRHLVNCMQHDNLIMGVCGETRIANKRQSWVTAIQVYEYFISHHLAKAFESVFGGVTCLPGCFSMYRLKARKINDDDWVPIITKPEIVREYSQSEVTTLHQKNLLLLGEDRFLTTILLRAFPNRKMMFCPQARCRTVAPDTFAVLLSQRRRWINSTIHNLMELVKVRNLCGTFCFSMQFVVFMDLIGTVVLPVAISLTYALVVNSILTPPKTFEQAIPLMLLASVLGLPAVLILITTRKIVYVFWMLIYLLALPVWNFILPVYSFWHFDDFSWGETRKVEGEVKDKGHGAESGAFAGIAVPMRRWEDWERSRLKKLRRDEKRRRDLARNFPGGYHENGSDFLRPRSDDDQGHYYDGGSDTVSIISSEDDQWGTQIGGYNENNSQYPPPPATLLGPRHDLVQHAQTVGKDELEAMLDQGFDNSPRHHNHPLPSSTAASSSTVINVPRYQLSEGPSSHQQFDAFGPLSPLANGNASGYPPPPQGRSRVVSPIQPNAPAQSISSAIDGDWKTHVKKRSGGGRTDEEDWGPLGPLGPAPGSKRM